jgi:hypothetical protein
MLVVTRPPRPEALGYVAYSLIIVASLRIELQPSHPQIHCRSTTLVARYYRGDPVVKVGPTNCIHKHANIYKDFFSLKNKLNQYKGRSIVLAFCE